MNLDVNLPELENAVYFFALGVSPLGALLPLLVPYLSCMRMSQTSVPCGFPSRRTTN